VSATSNRQQTRSWFGWMFRSRDTGRITIAQFPNLPLLIFLATVALRWVVRSGSPRTAVDVAGVVALAWWSVDEVIRGVNPWRRLLGIAGCAIAIASAVALA
jgi:hypothetical protein